MDYALERSKITSDDDPEQLKKLSERELLGKSHRKFQKLKLVQINTIQNEYIVTKIEELQNKSSFNEETPFYQAHGHRIQRYCQLPKGPIQQGGPVAISNISLLFGGVTTSEEFVFIIVIHCNFKGDVELKGYSMP